MIAPKCKVCGKSYKGIMYPRPGPAQVGYTYVPDCNCERKGGRVE